MKINAHNALVTVAITCLAVAGTSAGGWYYIDSDSRTRSEPAAKEKAAKVARHKREVEPHRLTVIGYVFPLVNGQRTNSIPVMIKLEVSGSDGLRAVCGRLPHVKEAVLRTLSSGGGMATDGAGRLDLAKIEPHLRQAINRATQGNIVKSLHAVMLSSGGGQKGSREECRAALTAGT